jgi:hypothetical protein
MESVNSIAELRGLRPGDSARCITVLGYLDPGDGGGGTFYWDNANVEGDDRGTIIAPSSASNPPPPGRWKRLWSGVLNVKWFGARGNWDEARQTGTDDYEALQAAAAAINVRGGGTLIFPRGIYRIDRYKITDGPNKNDWRDIVYQNCTGLHIIGYGAKIDVKGDFNQPADHFNPAAKRAYGRWETFSNIVQPFVFLGCTSFRLEGFELDGNVDKMTRKSKRDREYPDDPPRPVLPGPGYGIYTAAYTDKGGVLKACQQFTFADLYVHHFPVDGI